MTFIKEHICHLNATQLVISWFGVKLVHRLIQQLGENCQDK